MSLHTVNSLLCFMGRAPAVSTNSVRTINSVNVEAVEAALRKNQFKRSCWQRTLCLSITDTAALCSEGPVQVEELEKENTDELYPLQLRDGVAA